MTVEMREVSQYLRTALHYNGRVNPEWDALADELAKGKTMWVDAKHAQAIRSAMKRRSLTVTVVKHNGGWVCWKA